MTEHPDDTEVLPVDEPPKNGVWMDEHPELTEDEIEQGNALGVAIDPDDDEDNGLSG